MTKKINKSAIRKDIAQRLFNEFLASGEEYTCMASVFSTVRQSALKASSDLLDQGINLSKGNYPISWKSLMADMFMYDAAKLVHAKYYPS